MENQVQNGPVGETEAAPGPALNIKDLLEVRAVIEVASRRGAFQANELSAVGLVYDRLNNFLNAVAPPAAQPAEASNNQAPQA
jgi:hypothetical protein